MSLSSGIREFALGTVSKNNLGRGSRYSATSGTVQQSLRRQAPKKHAGSLVGLVKGEEGRCTRAFRGGEGDSSNEILTSGIAEELAVELDSDSVELAASEAKSDSVELIGGESVSEVESGSVELVSQPLQWLGNLPRTAVSHSKLLAAWQSLCIISDPAALRSTQLPQTFLSLVQPMHYSKVLFDYQKLPVM